MALKPKVLLDIKTQGSSPFAKNPRRLNLFSSRRITIYVKSAMKTLLSAAFALYLIFGYVVAPISPYSVAAETSEEERRALESQLLELERQIAEQEITIAEYRKQKQTLEKELSSLNAKIKQLNLQLKATTLTLDKLGTEIKENEGRVMTAEDRLAMTKSALSKLLQQLYEADRTNLFNILLQSEKLSDFVGGVNDLMAVQSDLSVTIAEVTALRDELLEEREQLALRRNDVEALKTYQAAQKANIEETKQRTNTLLVETKGQESKYQEILKQTRQSAAEIRSRLFELLGGGEMTFEEAYKLARLAEQATDVPASLVLAVLDRESRLGQNVGRCDYETAMHPTRDKPVFLAIIETLGLQSNLATGLLKVSCPIRSDGAFGGAMGPAQFIPSTWALYAGYEKNGSSWIYNASRDRIAKVTGSVPTSPWRNSDAFVATALYLKDAYDSQSCIDYSNQIPSESEMLRRRCAAAKYYAGGRWYTYRFAYGQPVVERALRFEQDIAILNA